MAILDESARIVGTLSASDLRGITPKGFRLIETSSVAMFLAKAVTGKVGEMVVVGAANTMSDLLDKFVQEHVQSIYIVDANGHPIGVVGLGQVLCELANAWVW